MYLCMSKCFENYISHFDLYVTWKNISSFNYFSKHNKCIANYTMEFFPFFKEYEPTCN